MKALIVDDEKHVRDAIRMLVDWDRYGIEQLFEAPEGTAAMSIIEREQPEIIFTDMRMPVVDGTELMQWIHQHHPACKVIVVSGHDDFEYVRHTVKYGGLDYILKPIDADELDEALAKAVSSWQQEHEARLRDQMRTIAMNQIKPVYWDKIFSSLVQGESVYADFACDFRQEFGCEELPKQAQVAIISLDTMPGSLRSKFAANLDLLFFSLANIANEYLVKHQSGYAFRCWNSQHELVIFYWGPERSFLDQLLRIHDGILFALKSRLDIGIGTPRSFPGELGESYREARQALRQRNLLQPTGRIHHAAAHEVPRTLALPFGRYEADLRAALLSNREDQIRDMAERWISAVEKLDSITVEQMELWNHEYAVFKSRRISEYQQEDPHGVQLNEQPHDMPIIPMDEHGRLDFRLLLEEVTRDLLRLSSMIAKLRQRERSIVCDIVSYIEQHYQEELTLQHISDRFHLSREYISRRFKQELGENLSDYITRIRIDKAKLLLMNPQLRIVRIAEMVGYQDEKYFSKVFKKVTGLSPNQYRSM